MARRRLTDLGAPETGIDAAAGRAAATVTAAVAEARAAGDADPAEALTDVWADGGYEWRT